MTKHECAVIMAFTGVVMLKGNDLDIFYEYVAKILCRPVYTHEMAMLSEEIKEAARDDFVQLCRNASDEDKPLTNGDRIRAMDDEQLSDFLNAMMLCCMEETPCSEKYCPIYEGCARNVMCVERWLKQEASP